MLPPAKVLPIKDPRFAIRVDQIWFRRKRNKKRCEKEPLRYQTIQDLLAWGLAVDRAQRLYRTGRIEQAKKILEDLLVITHRK